MKKAGTFLDVARGWCLVVLLSSSSMQQVTTTPRAKAPRIATITETAKILCHAASKPQNNRRDQTRSNYSSVGSPLPEQQAEKPRHGPRNPRLPVRLPPPQHRSLRLRPPSAPSPLLADASFPGRTLSASARANALGLRFFLFLFLAVSEAWGGRCRHNKAPSVRDRRHGANKPSHHVMTGHDFSGVCTVALLV